MIWCHARAPSCSIIRTTKIQAPLIHRLILHLNPRSRELRRLLVALHHKVLELGSAINCIHSRSHSHSHFVIHNTFPPLPRLQISARREKHQAKQAVWNTHNSPRGDGERGKGVREWVCKCATFSQRSRAELVFVIKAPEFQLHLAARASMASFLALP